MGLPVRQCALHGDGDEPHWTSTLVGVRALYNGHPDGRIIPADRDCALSLADDMRIVDASEINVEVIRS